MASEFLRRQAAVSRKRIDEQFGPNAYGGSNYNPTEEQKQQAHQEVLEWQARQKANREAQMKEAASNQRRTVNIHALGAGGAPVELPSEKERQEMKEARKRKNEETKQQNSEAADDVRRASSLGLSLSEYYAAQEKDYAELTEMADRVSSQQKELLELQAEHEANPYDESVVDQYNSLFEIYKTESASLKTASDAYDQKYFGELEQEEPEEKEFIDRLAEATAKIGAGTSGDPRAADAEATFAYMPERSATEKNRVENVLGAGGKGYQANVAETLGFLMSEGGNEQETAADVMFGAAGLTDVDYEPQFIKDLKLKISEKAYAYSDKMNSEAEEHTIMAKDGVGTFGSMVVDAGIAGTQMAMDMGIAALTHTSALVPMAVRSFGGGATEARQAGADWEQQFAYGVGSAAVEILTEKIGNVALPFGKMYGAGALDDLIKAGIEKTARSNAGRLALTMLVTGLSEGSEELISSLLNPLLKKMTYDPDALQEFGTSEFWGETLEEFIIGAMLGGIGGSVEIASDFVNSRAAGAEFRGYGEEVIQAIIDTGLESDPKTLSYQLAKEAQQKLDAGKTLSDREIGNMYYANVRAIAMEQAGEEPEDTGAPLDLLDTEEVRTKEAPAPSKTAETGEEILTERYQDQIDLGEITLEQIRELGAEYDAGATMAEIDQRVHEIVTAEQKEDAPAIESETNEVSPVQGPYGSESTAGSANAESVARDDEDVNVKVGKTIQRLIEQGKTGFSEVVQEIQNEFDFSGEQAEQYTKAYLAHTSGEKTFGINAEGNFYAVKPEEHIDQREMKSVGKRTMPSFQYQHPELHRYFSEAAEDMLADLRNSEKGTRGTTEVGHYSANDQAAETGGYKFWGSRRHTTKEIAYLLDQQNLSYADVEKALNAIIQDKGQENYAAAKRVELVLDDMLTYGHTSLDGYAIPANEAYIEAKNKIAGAETENNRPIVTMDETGVHNENERTLFDGGQGREADRRTGGQAGILSEKPKQKGNQSRTAVERQNRVAELNTEYVSAKALGIRTGTDNLVLSVYPESEWDDELRRIQSQNQVAGLDTVFLVGGIQIGTNGDYGTANGVFSDGTVYVRVDHTRYSAEEIAKHERYHRYVQNNAGLNYDVMQHLQSEGGERLQRVYQDYFQRCESVYDFSEMDEDEIVSSVFEEIAADAYAEMRGSNALEYADGVREIVERYVNETDTETENTESDAPPVREDAATAAVGNKGPTRYSIDTEFASELDAWNGKSNKIFRVGTTSEALQSIGVEDRNIVWHGKKIAEILRKHSGMTLEIIQKVPEVLENPVIILQSKNSESRLAIFGEITDRNGAPITAILELQPTNKGGELLDMNVIVSAYGKDSNPSGFIKSSGLVYLDPDKKRTDNWLRAVGLQLPSVARVNYGSVGRVSYQDGKVKIDSVPYQQYMQGADQNAQESNGASPFKTGVTSEGGVTGGDAPLAPNLLQQDEKVKDENAQPKYSVDTEADEFEAELEDATQKAMEEMRRRNEERLNALIDDPEAYEQRLAEERAARLQNIPKANFPATPAMEKLGIKVEGSIGRYGNTEQLKQWDRSAKQIREDRKRAEKRLNLTDEEKEIARQIANGVLSEEDIPNSMNPSDIMELADHYSLERATDSNAIKRQRSLVTQQANEKVEADFAHSEQYNPLPNKSLTKLIMNERTPERIMRSIFGQKKGAQIYNDYFWTVETNEAERFRFLNRTLDEVRRFRDKTGKERVLTREERALAQKVKEGRAVAEAVASMEMSEAIQNAAAQIRETQEFKDAEQAESKKEHRQAEEALASVLSDVAERLNLTAEQAKDARYYARWIETQQELEAADATIIENAVKKYDELYNTLYEAINDFLLAHGYDPIPFRSGYAPHMQSEKSMNSFMSALKNLGVNTEGVSSLPTSIAGRTADFKPNMKWNPYFQSRTGDFTVYDIQAGFESYLTYISDVFYHTDDIMRLRAVSRYLRKTYSPEIIRGDIEWAEGLRDMRKQQKESFLIEKGKLPNVPGITVQEVNNALEEYIAEQYEQISNVTAYGEFVSWLDNYINIQAGKQSLSDRGLEYSGGRTFLNIGSRLMRMFSRTNVGGNLSSGLNQTAQAPMIAAELGTKYTIKAIGDIVTGHVRKAAFVERSDFLTGKDGIKWITKDGGEKFIEALFAPASFMDMMVSEVAVRGAYLKALANGATETDAMKQADAFGRRVMGSRMKGTKPIGFESKTFVSQMLHIFQVEVSNTFDHVISDMPAEIQEVYRAKGKGAAVARVAATLVGYLISAFLLNRIGEEVYGGTPIPFDIFGITANFFASGYGLPTNEYMATIIDNAAEKITGERLFGTDTLREEFDFEAGASDSLGNAANDIPYLSNVAGLLGIGDQSLPTVGFNEMLKNVLYAYQDLKGADGKLGGGDARTGEVLEDLLYALVQVLPGGRQIKKTYQGGKTMINEGYTTGSGDTKKLQYPVEGSLYNWISALLFGRSGLRETEAFYAGDDNGLTAKQTAAYYTLRADGMTINEIMAVDAKWNELQADEEMTAKDKATAFAYWVDTQGLDEDNTSLIKDTWTFSTGFTVKADTYEKYVDAGLSNQDAQQITEALGQLQPEAGYETVRPLQKLIAIAELPISENAKDKAIRDLYGDSEKAYSKYRAAIDAGAVTVDYADLMEAIDRIDENGSLSQAEFQQAVLESGFPTAAAKALWYAQGWKKTSPWG